MYQHKVGQNAADENKLAEYKRQFDEAINDDLNIPLALGVVWTMIKEPKSKAVYDLALELDKVLGLSLDKPKPSETQEEQIPEDIRAIAEERYQAKKNRDFAKADELRNKLSELGYTVADSKDGYTVTSKN